MTTSVFNKVAIIGKPDHQGANETVLALLDLMARIKQAVVIEERLAKSIGCDYPTAPLNELGEQADLAIVVGGDGNMLGAARVLSRYKVAVIGVNRGNLGFLTDLSPDNFEQPLLDVLQGRYKTEYRFLLNTEVYRHGQLKSANTAVNEAVLHPGKIAHMIAFEVAVDDDFVFQQRADGLIVSTPTGSTAYSLSGGGPILTQDLDAMCLLPMFPHTLSARPIVIKADSEVKLRVLDENDDDLMISCDGHVTLAVMPGDEIIIRKAKHRLRLVHPPCYNYYEVLRSKLGWASKLF
ncbi:NAD(+) kinase [Neiella sp. HB171785]|uniref:NAD kinase n=1 Tax=Neiella litorisoli TaxID=2771431 RepID=A0A8J6QUN0_9GAMM|nr:NAD(+) kinase [Neiella litorisoli]MBD1389248.1 NAD(+) kinase [Neiella litorisoli]